MQIWKPALCPRQKTMPASHYSVFTGWMPFLPPNQQRQSTEGWVVTKMNNLSQWWSKCGSALILHVREKMQFLHFSISPSNVETSVMRGGIRNHHSIAYYLCNISAKNYQNRLMCVEVIVCNINVVFWDTVYIVLSATIMVNKVVYIA